MKSIQRYKETDLQKAVEKLASELRLAFSDAEIEAVFAGLSLRRPTREVSRIIRKLVGEELEKKMQELCAHFSKKFESEPKLVDLVLALEAAGIDCSRRFRLALLAMLKAQNAERWASASAISKRTVKLSEGEVAMWEALQRTYNLNPDAIPGMLLRLFAAVTSTAKVPYLDVPFVTSALTDASLKRYALSLNFSIKKPRKSRV